MDKKEIRKYGVARLRELKDAAIILDLEMMDVDDDLALYDSIFHCFAKGELDNQFESIVFNGMSEDDRVNLIDLVKDYKGLCFYNGRAEYWLDSLENMSITDSELITYCIFDNYDFLLELGKNGGKRVLDQLNEFQSSGYVNTSVVEYLRQSNIDDDVLKTILLDMSKKDSLYNVFSDDQKALLLGNPVGTLYTYTEDGVVIKSPIKLACELYVEVVGEAFDPSEMNFEKLFTVLKTFLESTDIDIAVTDMSDEYVSDQGRISLPDVIDNIEIDTSFDYLKEISKDYATSYDESNVKVKK